MSWGGRDAARVNSGGMRLRSTVGTATVLVVAIAALSGCGLVTPVSSACADWVWFDTPVDAAADADAVVIGRVLEQDGTAARYGVDAGVWTFEVSSWVQGAGGDVISVVSSPRTCEAGSPYPDGDPMSTHDEVMVFLRGDGEEFDTITGLQGVILAPVAPGIPVDWPPTSEP